MCWKGCGDDFTSADVAEWCEMMKERMAEWQSVLAWIEQSPVRRLAANPVGERQSA